MDPDNSGKLSAICNLDSYWDDPLPLNISCNPLPQDMLFDDKVVVGTRTQNSSTTFGDLLSNQAKELLNKKFYNPASPEKKSEAAFLLKEWNEIIKHQNVNKFAQRMISGRLKAKGLNGFSGVAALIARLRSRDIDFVSIKGNNLDDENRIENLYSRTLDFVRQTKPASFLKDLVLSEIIISWYWNQSLAEV